MSDVEIRNWYYEKHGDALIRKLEKRGFKAYWTATADEGRDKVLSLIPEDASVIFTGSQTLEQIGVKPYIRQSGKYRLIDPYEPGIAPEESMERRRQGLLADVMVSSTNAITEEGVLVNVDGTGNRVAGMIFGPKKVVLAIGMNKLATDVHKAWDRMRNLAAPLNNKRLGLPNPCAETGFCQDCGGKTRICNYFTTVERSWFPDRIHIVLIGEDLGY